LRRGEFEELILHLLLRDFHNTIPLLSKVYFKDSLGHAVHGFDAVHIEPTTKTLWLGESKLYTSGKAGLKALITDIEEHFKSDYLTSEFMLISKKLTQIDNIPDKDYWLDLISKSKKLIDQLNTINIPLLCTYHCDLFTAHTDENNQIFIDEYIKEMRLLNSALVDCSISSGSSASILKRLGVNRKKLSKSASHQFSTDSFSTCSFPLSSTAKVLADPFTINPMYLHTSPSCKKYCLFRSFLGLKYAINKRLSSSESNLPDIFSM